jgi:hypothetical protein
MEAEAMKRLGCVTVPLLLLVSSGYAAETSQLSAGQVKVLEAARASALQYRQQLPDFICTQITHRNNASKNMGGMKAGIATQQSSMRSPRS